MLKGKHYCITMDNITAHELIGLRATIIESNVKNMKGLEGKVVDETKNVLVIESKGAKKKVPKAGCVFGFELGNETAWVGGKSILYAPEQRLKAL